MGSHGTQLQGKDAHRRQPCICALSPQCEGRMQGPHATACKGPRGEGRGARTVVQGPWCEGRGARTARRSDAHIVHVKIEPSQPLDTLRLLGLEGMVEGM
eukprot:33879-Prymnesium_polylepis.1